MIIADIIAKGEASSESSILALVDYKLPVNKEIPEDSILKMLSGDNESFSRAIINRVVDKTHRICFAPSLPFKIQGEDKYIIILPQKQKKSKYSL